MSAGIVAGRYTVGFGRGRRRRREPSNQAALMNRQLFQHHPVIGYTFVSGLKARVEHEAGGYLIRTNRAGFRCRHEFDCPKRPGAFRVLLFGDSYTAGDGVSDRHRYCELLEQLLPGVEVFNFALPGTGTDQQYLIWREFARDVEADLVVIAVLVENIRRVVAHSRVYATPEGAEILLAKPYFTLASDGSIVLHNVPVPKEPLSPDASTAHVDRGGRWSGLRAMIRRWGPKWKDRIQRLTGYQPLPSYNSATHPDWRLLKAILTEWTSQIRKPVLLCPLPIYQYVEETSSPRNYQARFQELHHPPAVTVHDPLPAFLQTPRAERRAFRFAVDVHPTPAAHAVIARSLAMPIRHILNLPEASAA